MRKKIISSFSLVITALIFITGCSSTSGLVSAAMTPNVKLDFEDVVQDKIWYTKLESVEGDSNNIYQIKLQFNTAEKTFERETYKLERYGHKNTYKSAGYNNQKGNYYYGKNGKEIFYVLTEDYDVSANSSKIDNIIDSEPKKVEYLVESEESINWDGNAYYEKDVLEGKTIGKFTDYDFEDSKKTESKETK